MNPAALSEDCISVPRPRSNESIDLSIPPSALQRTDIAREPKKSNSLQIAWLMTFPNSGTSYTSHLVKSVSQTQIASNYASMRASRISNATSSVPVFEDQLSGPFWGDFFSTQPKPTKYVLTKTHCGAPCVYCPPDKYVELWYNFRLRCLSGDRLVVDDAKEERWIEKVLYPPFKVGKAVHLFRNPFDNAVARFRYERKGNRSATGFESTRAGFRAYCSQLNERYREEENQARFLNPGLLHIAKNVPCHAEIIRYVEWHNMASITIQDMNLDALVVHYDWYETQFNETVDMLLDFLQLERKDEPVPFQAGKTYSDYFTKREQAAVHVVLQTMALNNVWTHLKRYFTDQ